MKISKKLNLDNLKVESFVTSIEGKDSQTVKGGTGSTTGCVATTVIMALYVSLAAGASVIVVKGASAHNHC